MPIFYTSTGSIDRLEISSSAVFSGSSVISGSLVITGSVVVGTGGIRFPANQISSSDFNTLDDYEEGSWTPAFGSGTNWSYVAGTGRAGTYTKIGNMVTVVFYVSLTGQAYTASAGTNQLVINNLPFASRNITNANFYSTVAITAVAATTSIATPAQIPPNTTNILFYRVTAATNNALGSNFVQNSLGSVGVVQGCLTYTTN